MNQKNYATKLLSGTLAASLLLTLSACSSTTSNSEGESLAEVNDNTPAVSVVSNTIAKQGIGVVTTPRLGPGSSYSLNQVVAYVVTDNEERVVDMEIDYLEMITNDHGGEDDNILVGFPSQSYNEKSQDEESFLTAIDSYQTKRELGDAYKVNSGSFSDEYDIYESLFIGKTLSEIQEWFNNYTDVNGRPLRENSKAEGAVDKYNNLSTEEKAILDSISGATISLSDSHGDAIGAIAKAMSNLEVINTDKEISKIGLGVDTIGRVGPGKGVYCINTAYAGTLFDENGEIVASLQDILEIITPGHDGEDDNTFPGWPTQTYTTSDGTTFEQTEESFVESTPNFKTKRDLGAKYQLASDSWINEMTKFTDDLFVGKTIAELDQWVNDYTDVNGRPLKETSTADGAEEKYNALTAEEKAMLDGLAGASISLNDRHGDVLRAIEKSYENAKSIEKKN